MIDRNHALPLARRARQLAISRGGIYYLPRALPDADLAIMRRIDELHLLYPFAGSRMLRDLLRQDGVGAGRLLRGAPLALGEIREVYFHAYAPVPEARAGIGRYIRFCNAVRPHSALGGRTPDRIYFAQPLPAAAWSTSGS